MQAMLLGIVLVASALRPSAQTIVNGDMNGVANTNTWNNVIPPGWTGVWGGTDLWDGATTVSLTKWQFSYGGGTFVHGVGNSVGAEWVSQQVTGLTVGTAYAITFEQTISNSAFVSDTFGFWRVEFGPDTLDSDLMQVPPLGVSFPWQPQTLIFTASSTTQLLKFRAYNLNPPPPSGIRTENGLDTVRINVACPNLILGFEFVIPGVPPNPLALLPSITGPPVIGTVWDPSIDHTTFVPNSILDIYALSLLPANIPSPPAGTILCSPPIFTLLRPPTDSLGLLIPYSCSLTGVRLCVSGVSIDPSFNFFLTNALEISFGNM